MEPATENGEASDSKVTASGLKKGGPMETVELEEEYEEEEEEDDDDDDDATAGDVGEGGSAAKRFTFDSAKLKTCIFALSTLFSIWRSIFTQSISAWEGGAADGGAEEDPSSAVQVFKRSFTSCKHSRLFLFASRRRSGAATGNRSLRLLLFLATLDLITSGTALSRLSNRDPRVVGGEEAAELEAAADPLPEDGELSIATEALGSSDSSEKRASSCAMKSSSASSPPPPSSPWPTEKSSESQSLIESLSSRGMAAQDSMAARRRRRWVMSFKRGSRSADVAEAVGASGEGGEAAAVSRLGGSAASQRQWNSLIKGSRGKRRMRLSSRRRKTRGRRASTGRRRWRDWGAEEVEEADDDDFLRSKQQNEKSSSSMVARFKMGVDASMASLFRKITAVEFGLIVSTTAEAFSAPKRE
jgi:hypothetical protein